MLTDSRDTILLASRASDLGATEFLAHFQARAARRTPFCPVPRLKLVCTHFTRNFPIYPQGADLLEAQWLAADSLPSHSVALFNEQRSWARALMPVEASQAMNIATPTADDDSGLFDDYLGPDLLATDDAAFA